ncbi:MAG: hypothetical protein QXE81_05865 [Desulfurococcaceae archaeon]
MSKFSLGVFIGVLVLMMFTSIVSASNPWSFYKQLTDTQYDNNELQYDNNELPGYTDIVVIDYGFNETHFSVNITVRESIVLGEGEIVWVGVLVDTDVDSTTGYRFYDIGADYYVEMYWTSIGGNIALYRYKGPDWAWEELQGWNIYFEVVDKTYSMVVEKGSIEFPSGVIRISPVITYKSANVGPELADYLDPTLLPIPESILVPVSIGLVVAVILYKFRRALF